MDDGQSARLRNLARRIFVAGLRAVDPAKAVRRAVRVDGKSLRVAGQRFDLTGRIFVVGAGKGSGAMAAAVEELLGERITEGRVTVKDGYGVPTAKITIGEAAHPRPDERGAREADRALRLVRQAGPDDLVLCLISGGGSALWPAPAGELSLADKMEVTDALLACGANILQINCVRKHISRIKGGQLARAAAPARVISLILSDVIGDPLEAIASGPTAPDPSTHADAVQVIELYGLGSELPEEVVRHLQNGVEGRLEETPKPQDPLFERVLNVIIGSNRLALDAAVGEAEKAGFHPLVLSTSMQGEAREVARRIVAMGEEVATSGRPVQPPACLLAGGETTVTLGENPGRGGRCQEMGLAAALELAGRTGLCFLAAGTDGTDGPDDAAGAVVDGGTLARGQKLGRPAAQYLTRHDAYLYFVGMDEHLITGPTRTNVMDIYMVLVEHPEIT